MKWTQVQGAGWWRALATGDVSGKTSSLARLGCFTRQAVALSLSGLMILIPMGQSSAFAQPLPVASPAAPEAAGGQALTAEQLNQLVAPIALYPDALTAQVLVAATYPTQVVQANRWRQAQGNASPEQVAAAVDSQNWDPSVKALTAFPSVLAQMDRNLQWTTDLGNAYYNQPQDVMSAVQTMRHRAYAAGTLRSTQQQAVTVTGGDIEIVPATPTVVYVPVYDPWVVYGAPVVVYPGYYYAAPPGVFWGGMVVGFGIGIGIGVWADYGWGWHHWGMGWHDHFVHYGGARYYTRSSTVINYNVSRPGGPGPGAGARGAFARPGGSGAMRSSGAMRGATASRGASSMSRGGGANGSSRSTTSGARSSVAGRSMVSGGTGARSMTSGGGSYNRSSGTASYGNRSMVSGGQVSGARSMSSQPSYSRGSAMAAPSGGHGGASMGGGRSSGGGFSGGGGGHEGGGGHRR